MGVVWVGVVWVFVGGVWVLGDVWVGVRVFRGGVCFGGRSKLWCWILETFLFLSPLIWYGFITDLHQQPTTRKCSFQHPFLQLAWYSFF